MQQHIVISYNKTWRGHIMLLLLIEVAWLYHAFVTHCPDNYFQCGHHKYHARSVHLYGLANFILILWHYYHYKTDVKNLQLPKYKPIQSY